MGVKKRARKAWANQAGQMTVELAVAFPVVVAVAVIAMNALLFLSECAAFDRVARDAVRVHATSPGLRPRARAEPCPGTGGHRGGAGPAVSSGPASPLRTEGRDG